MNPNQTIKKNLKRVHDLIDSIQYHNDIPLFSWLEISPIDMCNRKCIFCPKSDDSIAPNVNNEMHEKLYTKIANELLELDYQGTVMLAGYGEPMMHKTFLKMVETFSRVCNTETTINGDFLNTKNIKELVNAGIHKIIISLYDGPEQIEKFKDMFKKAGVSDTHYILRDRWYDESQDFGVKLTNRAGTLKRGEEVMLYKNKQCYYPHYSMMIDWNGDCYLCTQDWSRRVKSGNLMISTLVEVWTSKILKKYRTHLSQGNRDLFPCSQCNATGTLQGEQYKIAWEKFYDSKK